MLTLFEISGFSYAEIAQIQEVTEQKVKATLYQSRQQLKWLIEKEKGEGN
jgi:DNA-directed RNA polymerase specialized sigma24 family protein